MTSTEVTHIDMTSSAVESVFEVQGIDENNVIFSRQLYASKDKAKRKCDRCNHQAIEDQKRCESNHRNTFRVAERYLY